MLVPIYWTTWFHIPGEHKFSTHHYEDLLSHLLALFVLMLAAVLLTGSCWAGRVQTAECRTGCPYSRTESWTASSCVSLPVVPLWTWQSGLHFHTCTHKVASHNTTVFWSLKFNQNSVPTSYQILTYLILVNNQLDTLFSMYLFISLLYMFRVTQCSSSGEMNCINTSSGIYHSV